MPLAIKIRIAELELSPKSNNVDLRQEFWSRLGDTNNVESISNTMSVSQLEAKLQREFGRRLATHMRNHISFALDKMDRAACNERYFDFMGLRVEAYKNYDYGAAYSRYLEFRQQLIRDNPTYSDAIRRLGDASNVLIRVTIRNYTSLNLDVDISPLRKVASAFESDFDSFRVFLDVFVPQTFAEIFSVNFANSFSYNIEVLQDCKQAFLAIPQPTALQKAVASAATPTVDTKVTDSQKRAEWLWRLANGSLLFPVVVAIIVLYLSWQEMSSLRESQRKSLESSLDHQLKLLEEDRQRLDSLLNLRPSPISANEQATKSGTPSVETR
jgi:hypothetical protein